MYKNRHFGLSVGVLFLLLCAPLQAQVADQQPEQFAATATAVDGASLLTSSYLITLWGIEPIEVSGSSVALRARTDLDNMMAGQAVSCEVKEWRQGRPSARCLSAREVDLGLAMVEAGYAVVDRPAVSGTVFENQYITAEQNAQKEERGGWALGEKDTAFLKYFFNNETFVYGWVLGVIGLPLIGFLLTWLLITARLSAMERYLQKTIGESEARQKDLREQERFVVASMIEGELSANKGKLEAFIIIYKDLLKSLRQSKEHRYQTNGEIVHDAPLLERAVFESNLNRLDLLGAAMAGEIVGLYGHIHSNPNYTTLDGSIALDEAILKVQKVVVDAESLIPRIDKIIQSLHVTIRDRQTRQVKSSR